MGDSRWPAIGGGDSASLFRAARDTGSDQESDLEVGPRQRGALWPAAAVGHSASWAFSPPWGNCAQKGWREAPGGKGQRWQWPGLPAQSRARWGSLWEPALSRACGGAARSAPPGPDTRLWRAQQGVAASALPCLLCAAPHRTANTARHRGFPPLLFKGPEQGARGGPQHPLRAPGVL